MIGSNVLGNAIEWDIVENYRSGLGVNHGDRFMIRRQDGLITQPVPVIHFLMLRLAHDVN